MVWMTPNLKDVRFQLQDTLFFLLHLLHKALDAGWRLRIWRNAFICVRGLAGLCLQIRKQRCQHKFSSLDCEHQRQLPVVRPDHIRGPAKHEQSWIVTSVLSFHSISWCHIYDLYQCNLFANSSFFFSTVLPPVIIIIRQQIAFWRSPPHLKVPADFLVVWSPPPICCGACVRWPRAVQWPAATGTVLPASPAASVPGVCAAVSAGRQTIKQQWNSLFHYIWLMLCG